MERKNTPGYLIILFLSAAVFCGASLSRNTNSSDIPQMSKQPGVTQLTVENRPFLILGGELHNSSASSVEYMKPIWPKLAKMNLNTVLVPVYWELIEPAEGKFDFEPIDGLIEGARENNLRLVLLWFGSWKNSMSCYTPAWVKTDQVRFPRARVKDGPALEILSPFGPASCEADARAFAELMKHIRKVDGKKHTVVMVQVENEIGMLTDARDYSEAANAAFEHQVPKELMDYISKHKGKLIDEFENVWSANGYKTSGTWEGVFGKGLATDEIFMAWYFGRYVNQVAEAGKAEYSLPMYVNAALIRPNYKPGQYPSAGPLPHLMDVWRAAAPQIDFIAPDIYFPNFKEWCEKYHQSGNPLFVPEVGRGSENPVNAFYAIGRYDAMGFSPFGIESISEESPLADAYEVLAQMSPLILENQGKGVTAGVLLDKDEQRTELQLGGYVLNIKHDYTWGWSGGDKDSESWPLAGGVIISTGPDEYVIAGSGFIVTFETDTEEETAGILNVQEGSYENGMWIGGRWLNGDENHQGRHVRLPFGDFAIQRVRLYRYR